jgi:hypothetical protein
MRVRPVPLAICDFLTSLILRKDATHALRWINRLGTAQERLSGLAKNEPIRCIVKRDATSSVEEDSLAENVRRCDLHPLDQFHAFKTLSDQGLDVE